MLIFNETRNWSEANNRKIIFHRKSLFDLISRALPQKPVGCRFVLLTSMRIVLPFVSGDEQGARNSLDRTRTVTAQALKFILECGTHTLTVNPSNYTCILPFRRTEPLRRKNTNSINSLGSRPRAKFAFVRHTAERWPLTWAGEMRIEWWHSTSAAIQIHQCTLHCWTAEDRGQPHHFFMTIYVCNDDNSVGIFNNANIINNVLHSTICKGWFIYSGDEATRTSHNQNHRSRAFDDHRRFRCASTRSTL